LAAFRLRLGVPVTAAGVGRLIAQVTAWLIAPIESSAWDCAQAAYRTAGHTVFRIRRLDPAD
jgi:hypothetical protein